MHPSRENDGICYLLLQLNHRDLPRVWKLLFSLSPNLARAQRFYRPHLVTISTLASTAMAYYHYRAELRSGLVGLFSLYPAPESKSNLWVRLSSVELTFFDAFYPGDRVTIDMHYTPKFRKLSAHLFVLLFVTSHLMASQKQISFQIYVEYE
jgi:hypothetical protein